MVTSIMMRFDGDGFRMMEGWKADRIDSFSNLRWVIHPPGNTNLQIHHRDERKMQNAKFQCMLLLMLPFIENRWMDNGSPANRIENIYPSLLMGKKKSIINCCWNNHGVSVHIKLIRWLVEPDIYDLIAIQKWICKNKRAKDLFYCQFIHE